ncbi:MAG: TIGR01458 family HAD-type hydrolase [Bacteroidota bacterium]|nr:TIGR01458 family HAD-type hydrolase [Bacteroidota bacterium]
MDFDGFLFDLNGVFYEDENIISGANETIDWLKKNSIPYKFISNNSTLSRKLFVEKLKKIGLKINIPDVITSNYAGVLTIKKMGLKNCKLIMTEEAKLDYKKFQLQNKKIDAIVIGDIGEKWSFSLMNELMNDVISGAEIIALHKGKYYQSQGKLKIDCGAFVAGLEYSTSKKAISIGKPKKSFFDLAAFDLGTNKICLVGDDLHNDIEGGQKMGYKTILVKTGKYRQNIFDKSKIKPDFCIPSIKELIKLFKF